MGGCWGGYGAGGKGEGGTKGMERFFVCAHNSIELTKKERKKKKKKEQALLFIYFFSFSSFSSFLFFGSFSSNATLRKRFEEIKRHQFLFVFVSSSVQCLPSLIFAHLIAIAIVYSCQFDSLFIG